MKVGFLYALICFTVLQVTAQKSSYPFSTIPDSLKNNANAVIRLDQTEVQVLSQRNMTVKTQRVVTVLNEKGLEHIEAVVYYDKRTTVKNIEAEVFDASGATIKKIKRKDFRDQCVIDGITIFSDNRYLYLDYTPVQYPFTIVFESEISTSNTAFMPTWMPLDDYFVSVEKSTVNVIFSENLGFKKKEFAFAGFAIQKSESKNNLQYTASQLIARKKEDSSPDIYSLFPKVMFGLESFHLEGVDGKAATWQEFGQWYAEKILSDGTALSETTKTTIRNLVGAEKDPIKKAKIVYDFIQKKSRYVSIQVGIGGWKPMPATDVDRLGYGDCKALSNYAKTLLDAVGVTSYHTVLYGSRYPRNIQSDFVSMQGNHMILCIPNGKENVFLECTSQDDPFGFQANFTDDRDVLVIKPEGGEIVHTKEYSDLDNLQTSLGSYVMSDDGSVSGSVAIVSQGTQYGNKFRLQSKSPTDTDKHYKTYWSHINNLKLRKNTFSDDKETVRFTENVAWEALNYGNISGDRMIFPVNAYNLYTANNKRIRNRKTPFEIARGFYDEDEITINLPTGYTIESLPKDYELNGKFGTYKTTIIKKGDKELVYKRTLLLKKGLYANQEYEEYRVFTDQVARNDYSKIVLIKKQ